MVKGRFNLFTMLAAVCAIAFSCEEPPAPPQGKALSFSWENMSYKVGYSTTSASLSIVARLDWTLAVSEGADWLGSPSVVAGTKGTTTIRFSFAANDGETARTARITVRAIGEDEPYVCVITQTPIGVLSGVNEWIYNQLGGWYYWNDAMKAADQPDATLDYDDFLTSLVANAYSKGAYDEGSPRTIDGGYDSEGERYYYSYITRTPAKTRSTPVSAPRSKETTFGFDVMGFFLDNPKLVSNPRIGLMVIWVQPGSPAAEAGLKRGTWIAKYNGADLRLSDWERFIYQLNMVEGSGRQMTVADPEGNSYSITAAEIKSSPILVHKVLDSPGGKKVAYLFYERFELGDNLGTDRNPRYEFAEELRDVFGEFKDAGAGELVLDLRYNPGGYVIASQVLASLAANVDGTKVFSREKRNPDINAVWEPKYGWRVDNPSVEYFYRETNSLGLNKIYVLATEDSASASELVINSLRGVDIDVVHIGDTTSGKNVGMDVMEETFDGWTYEMRPITFRSFNARNEGDYADGFTPDIYLDEFHDLQDANPEIFELGDPRERLLKAALTLIDGGTVSPDDRTRAGATRAIDDPAGLLRSRERLRRVGMLSIPRQTPPTTE